MYHAGWEVEVLNIWKARNVGCLLHNTLKEKWGKTKGDKVVHQVLCQVWDILTGDLESLSSIYQVEALIHQDLQTLQQNFNEKKMGITTNLSKYMIKQGFGKNIIKLENNMSEKKKKIKSRKFPCSPFKPDWVRPQRYSKTFQFWGTNGNGILRIFLLIRTNCKIRNWGTFLHTLPLSLTEYK